ncbi:RidA family protein [Microvirga puerhi]|uniref:RidA family protein n=1 Tax=Microvirga puerhi TaxID=2876078 RepID=A0ABS7VTV0_9HYPH|nr:RidA family protein [Microvirga puerhi]MBZ6079007.1 RidA family protein [Microvirga puerhi]
MPDKSDEKLASLAIELPAITKSVKNYIHTKRTGDLLYVSGQLCFGPDGKIPQRYVGKIGSVVSPEDGYLAARLCLLHVLAHARLALGSLDAIKECVRLGGYVNAEPDYTDLAAVMNGASDAIVEILGERGRHSRTTIGVATLPLGSCVEVEAILEVASP